MLVVAGELLTPDAVDALSALLAGQPAWSDLPLIVVATDEPAGNRDPFDGLGNVAILHRPLSLDTLATTVRAALRARRRQYQVRDLLGQREEADRRKDEFLAMLAHELRNPLAPIRTGLQILRPRPRCGDRRADAGDDGAPGRHLSRMVDDLLDVSRITRGKIALRRSALERRRGAGPGGRRRRPDRGGEGTAGRDRAPGRARSSSRPTRPAWSR